MAAAVCDTVWRELHGLRDAPPPLDGSGEAEYRDYLSFASCNEIRRALGEAADLPREQFLEIFTRLVAGPRLEELFAVFKTSRNHPALQYACLVALHGTAELPEVRTELLMRQDVVRELLSVMSWPRQRLVTPASADRSEVEVVNSAMGAITTITGLFSSNGTLEPEHAKLWVDLGAVPALAASLECHAGFDRTSPVATDLPLCFFLISTSLLAGAADAVSEEDKLRLGKAWLGLFVRARSWIAHEAAELLADFFSRPAWLKGVVGQIPRELRARAVEAAKECAQEGGSWNKGHADHLALVLRCANAQRQDGDNAGGLGKQCAGPGCALVQTMVVGGDGGGVARFKRCSRCQGVLYCSKVCQAAHWKAGHRKTCVRLTTQTRVPSS